MFSQVRCQFIYSAVAMLPERLGSYELIERIGAGGMGEVWRALDPALGRHVAIKVLPSHYSHDPDRLRRFEQEARAAGSLNHPNVLTIYAVGKHDDTPYLVTELLEGASLRQRLSAGPMPEDRTREYGNQIVQGLAAAHEKGIVHRDLKPENIFITADGRVKILDFGLAKLIPTATESQMDTQTAAGTLLGTAGYMAPEQIRGQTADHRSDIFAFGAVFYEMLSGQRAFPGETSVEIMHAILKTEPDPIAGVSPAIDQIVRHCLEKDAAHRYQSARDLAFQLQLPRDRSMSARETLHSRPRRRLAAIAALITVATGAGIWWWLTRPATITTAPSFTRLTSDSGLTTDPAFSRDGQLVAFASDRAAAGNLDIWRQQLATGEAVRLTGDPADESEPAFSPDGSRIAFRSERDGGGIYLVSAFGGEPRLIAPRGRRPRFSPDGSRIAYWVRTGTIWYVGQIFTVAVSGGPPTRVQPEFASALYPIWSADGSRLLFNGARDADDLSTDAFDWWLAPAQGGPGVRTGALDILRQQQISEGPQRFASLIAPADWVGDVVYFSGWSAESTNLWRIALSQQTGQASGVAEKLTSGTAIEAKPSVIPGGRVAFASLTTALNIWSVPIAADSGRASGEAQQVTSSAFDARTSVSADGRKLVFISTRLGNPDVWIKDLASGTETALTATPAHEEEAEISTDGSQIAYTVRSGPAWTLFRIPAIGGPAEQLCDDCGRPWDWSPDGQRILFLIEEGRRHAHIALGLLDVAARQKHDYLVHSDYSLARARFSPDGRWISFMAFNTTGSHIVVVPFRSDAPPQEDQWIRITEHSQIPLDKPRWSPDGTLLYYMSDEDGFRCIWARRLEPDSKRPMGSPVPVYHSHSARQSLMNAGIPLFQELSLTRDQLFFNLGEIVGNIWMVEWKP